MDKTAHLNNMTIWNSGKRRLSLLKHPLSFNNVIECGPASTIWSTHFEIKMYLVTLKQESEFDRYLYCWFKIRRFSDGRKLYLHTAYEKGLFYMSMRFLTSAMKRHYLILLYKRYVEGVSVNELYEATPKCWVPPALREMPDLSEEQNPKPTIESCSLKVDVAVQTEQNSNSALVHVGQSETCALQLEKSVTKQCSAYEPPTVAEQTALGPSETCEMQDIVSDKSVTKQCSAYEPPTVAEQTPLNQKSFDSQSFLDSQVTIIYDPATYVDEKSTDNNQSTGTEQSVVTSPSTINKQLMVNNESTCVKQQSIIVDESSLDESIADPSENEQSVVDESSEDESSQPRKKIRFSLEE